MNSKERPAQKLTHRVFTLICLASFIVLAITMAIIAGELYNYLSDVQYDDLMSQTRLIAYGTEQNGISFIEGIVPDNHTIMWIDAGGKVIYDTTDDEIVKEEHAAFIEARKDGFGESTMILPSLVEKNVYSACRLSDGSVVIVSEKQATFFSPMVNFLWRALMIAIAAVLVSFIVADRFTSRIVRPINNADLDDTENLQIYSELMPFIDRIEAQQRELKQKEAELKSRRAEFEAAADNMREGLVLLNSDGNIISINKAATGILGVNRVDVGNTTLSCLGEFGALLDAARVGKSTDTVISIGDTDYQVNESPVESDGEVMGAVLFIFNITEREKAEISRREFTANVSHELKTPLQSISGYAELIMNGKVKRGDIPFFAQNIYRESQRMTALVKDIIKLSKLDAGSIEMQRTDIDLLESANNEVKVISRMPEAAGIKMEVTGESAVINAYPSLVSAIIHNLCENAVKYNRENGSVTVNVSEAPGAAVLTVSDTGIGIPREHLDRVFERFYRVDKSHSRKVGGTGLGLAIVKHAVRLSNASIVLESEPDCGTTVTVTFPV